MLKILAFSDVHSPRYFNKFRRALENLNFTPHLILIAGDLMEKGSLEGYNILVNYLSSRFRDSKIIACPGNEDFESTLKNVVNKDHRVEWLIDREVSISVKGFKLRIYGSKGVLDKPTPWQKRHIKDIEKIYQKRLEMIKNFINDVDLSKQDLAILLLHYSPTYATLEGEPPKIWPMLGTNRLEHYLKLVKSRLVVLHGHAHKSINRKIVLGNSIILNVSFPEKWNIFLMTINEDLHIDTTLSEVESFRDSGKLRSSILDYLT